MDLLGIWAAFLYCCLILLYSSSSLRTSLSLSVRVLESVLFDKSHYELEELRSGSDDVLTVLATLYLAAEIFGSYFWDPLGSLLSHGVKEPCKTFVADVRDVFCTYILT